MIVELRGGVGEVSELLRVGDTDPRGILVEGGAGTGKTRGLQEIVHRECTNKPGTRAVIARATRASMSMTVLEKPWESDVIAASLRRGSVRVQGGTNQRAYRYSNGSVVYPCGLDDVHKMMSGGLNIILIHEATDITLSFYQYLLTRVARESMSNQVIILDVNPGPETHWENRWANDGKLRRMLTKHWCNPLYYSGFLEPDGTMVYTRSPQGARYMAQLEQLTGPERDRLLLHKWVSAEGMVLPEWDPDVHGTPRNVVARYQWEAFYGGFDWGHTDAACLEVGGLYKGALYRLFEVYRTKEGYPWWADRIADVEEMLRRLYGRGFKDLVCSHERPELSDLINDTLRGRKLPPVARSYKTGPGAVKARIERLRWCLRPSSVPDLGAVADKTPRMFFLHDSGLWGPDQRLVQASKPISFEEEVVGIVWAPAVEGKRSKDVVDPGCANHGFDGVCMLVDCAWDAIRVSTSRLLHTTEAALGSFEASVEADLALLEPKRRRR